MMLLQRAVMYDRYSPVEQEMVEQLLIVGKIQSVAETADEFR